MHRVASPVGELVEAVNQVSHPAVVLPGQEISREQELCVPAVQSVGKLLVEVLQIVEQFFAGLVMSADIGAVGWFITTRL
jgi:hypothetical protein